MCSSVCFTITTIFLAGIPMFHAKPYNFYGTKWPAQCNNKSYCFTRPDSYPQENFDRLLEGTDFKWQPVPDIQNRSSDRFHDVGHCQSYKWEDRLYLIRDKHDQIRYVAQADKFKIRIATEECKKPGRITEPYYIDSNSLKDNKVYCYETKVPMKFMVLSIDGRSLESVAVKGGLPLSCSAKIMN